MKFRSSHLFKYIQNIRQSLLNIGIHELLIIIYEYFLKKLNIKLSQYNIPNPHKMLIKAVRPGAVVYLTDYRAIVCHLFD